MSKTVQSTCNYCGVGCNVLYHLDDNNNIAKVTAADYTVNKGVVCPKGFKIHEPILSKERGTHPMIRKNGNLEKVSWDEALTKFTDKVKSLQEKHGKKSVAFISTGQMYTEEMAILGQVGRTGMGMEGDGNTRQCMASAVVAYKQTFGFDAPPMSYQDIEESDCIVVIGSNMPITHPIVWNRIKYNKNNPDIIVMDPRLSDAAEKATKHLAIKPKRDIVFLYMVINDLISKGKIDKAYIDAHTTGFDNLKEVVAKYQPNDVERLTGISKEDFDSFVEKMHTKKKVSIWWTMGVNQSNSGTRTAQAIINLCLITGNIGKRGTGPCSLTGQANAMGSRLFSNTTSLFGGGNHENEEHRKQVASILNINPSRLPAKATLPYDKIIEAIDTGTIKGLWIICTNPLHSWINNTRIAKILDKLELFVVQDLYPNIKSAKLAHIYLPAAGAGEKKGSLINSERRIGVAQKAIDPPGEAKGDFEICQLVAKYYGCEDVIQGWETEDKVFEILKRCSEGKPCDFTGIRDYKHILDKGGIQWPYPKDNPDEGKERLLFADGKFFTADGKAKIHAEEFQAPPSEPTSEYPYYVLTGRGSIFQFQSNTRTQKSATLSKQMRDSIYVELNQADANTLNVLDGAKLKISSRSNSIEATVKISKSVAEGYIFLPFHYQETNAILEENFDPYSRQPGFKVGAVKLEAI